VSTRALSVFSVISVVKKRKNHRGTERTETTECPDYTPSSTIPISSSVSPYKLVPQPINLPVRGIDRSTRLTTTSATGATPWPSAYFAAPGDSLHFDLSPDPLVGGALARGGAGV